MIERMPSNASGKRTQAEAVALLIFDRAIAERLPGKARRLLKIATAYYVAVAEEGEQRSERVARDMVLSAPIDGLNAENRATVASVLAFQRDKVRPRREPSYIWLDHKHQRIALWLAAALRLAAASGAALGELSVDSDEAGTTLIAHGERAEQIAAAAEDGAAFWRDEIGALTVRTATAEDVVDTPPDTSAAAGGNGHPGELARPETPFSDIGGEPIAEAARRSLRRFFDKLLAREDAVLKDEDSEDVHQMRVATRRLRAALQILDSVYEPKLIRRYRKGLRQIARALGAVRDGDVFIEHVEAYRAQQPEDQRARLDPLIGAVVAERAEDRTKLVEALEARGYQKFKRDFAEFLSTPGAGALPAPEPGITERVRDYAGSAIWRRYELWRAYEEALRGAAPATLHQARIVGKRFRYTLEFFADALGQQVEQALDPLVALQETLGSLQDEVTARAHVAALGLADDPGAQAYLDARSIERAQLLAELPSRWEKVDSATYRRRLFELIVKL